MSDALRQLLAEFVVEVDKAGELAKGNAQVDALKKRIEALQESAKPAAKAVNDAFASIGAQMQKNLHALGAKALGGGGLGGGDPFAALAAQTKARLRGALGWAGGGLGGGDAFAGAIAAAGGPLGAQFGPTRQTLNAHHRAEFVAEADAHLLQQFGPTRETLVAGRAAMAAAEAEARRLAGTFKGRLAAAVQAVRDGFNSPGASGPGLIERLSDFRTQVQLLAGGAAVAGVKHLVESVGDLQEGSQRLGVSVEQFQRLSVLAKQSNTDVGALGAAFRVLASNAVDPSKDATAAFKKLGVSVKDASGKFKSSNDLFFDVGEALAGVSNETERTRLAQVLLGRGAVELKPIFASGTEAFRDQRKALADLNVLSADTVKQADDLADSWAAVGPSLLAAAEPLLKLLLPALEELTTLLIGGVTWVAKFLRQTDLVSVGLTALGAVLAMKVVPGLELMIGLGGGATRSLLALAGAGAKALWSFARLAIPLLLVEDFITFLRGGDSGTGRLLDALFGKGTAEGTLKAIKDTKDALVDLWNWITGTSGGERVKSFISDLDDGIRALLNDALAVLGIGKGGLDGFLKGSDALGIGKGAAELGDRWFGGPAAPTMATPALPPVGFYGPPTAEGSVSGNKAITFGDTNITVQVGQYGPAAPADIARAGFSAAEESRDRLISHYGGF